MGLKFAPGVGHFHYILRSWMFAGLLMTPGTEFALCELALSLATAACLYKLVSVNDGSVKHGRDDEQHLQLVFSLWVTVTTVGDGTHAQQSLCFI